MAMFNSYVSLPEGNTIRSSSKYVKQIIQWIGINRNKSRNKQAVLLKSQNEVGIQETSRNKICFSATGQPSPVLGQLLFKWAKTSLHDLKINGEKGDVPALFCHQVRSPKFRNGALARGAVTSANNGWIPYFAICPGSEITLATFCCFISGLAIFLTMPIRIR